VSDGNAIELPKYLVLVQGDLDWQIFGM